MKSKIFKLIFLLIFIGILTGGVLFIIALRGGLYPGYSERGSRANPVIELGSVGYEGYDFSPDGVALTRKNSIYKVKLNPLRLNFGSIDDDKSQLWKLSKLTGSLNGKSAAVDYLPGFAVLGSNGVDGSFSTTSSWEHEILVRGKWHEEG